jgi:hypothetical protein
MVVGRAPTGSRIPGVRWSGGPALV